MSVRFTGVWWLSSVLVLSLQAAPGQTQGVTPVPPDLPTPILPRPLDSDRDRFLQPLPPITPEIEDPAPDITPPPRDTQPGDPTQTLSVTRVEVVGSTIFGPEVLNPIVQPLAGREVSVEELRDAADAITQLYLDQGYVTSRAILGEQTIVDGVVQIQVFEGQIEAINIEGNQRVNPDYIRSRVQLGTGTPLRRDRLEDQLRLLRSDPLFENVEANLRAGSGFGQSILNIRVTEANAFQAGFNLDNYSPPSVGSERFGFNIGHRNVTGLGDSISASYFRSTTGGSNLYDLSYRIPLNPMNGTLQVRVAPSEYRITDPDFAAFNIRGRSDLYEVSYRQPLMRSPLQEFALSLGFTHQGGQSFIFDSVPTRFGVGPDEQGVSRTSVIKFGQDYVSRDLGGAWSLRSQFNFGTGLFGATQNPAPIPDGQFFSWLGQLQRVQLLGPDQLLIVQADLQLTPDTLLPSQQLVIGGGQSVRGFRQNARSGDNGFRVAVEGRFPIQRDAAGSPTLQLAPFADVGATWNTANNPNTVLGQQNFLAGLGMGILWQALPRMSVRVDYALPLVNLPDRTGNIQDSALYFNVNYQL